MRKLLLLALLLHCAAQAAADGRPNIILFVPDGLRAPRVDHDTAPEMTRLRDEGVNFANSHSLFPTFTTANASAFATGHGLGDTGDFSNVIHAGFPVQAAGGSVTPFLESDPVLAEMDQHYGGNYLDEESLLAAARKAGYCTAAIGKLGPAAIQDLGAGDGQGTLVVDDRTGREGGVPLAPEWAEAMKAAKLPDQAPTRGDNGSASSYKDKTPGTLLPNLAQQQYFVEVALKVVVPACIARHQPFALVYWSRDPDGTQHGQGDGYLRPNPDDPQDHGQWQIEPGINGPTSLAAVRSTDMALGLLRQGLKLLQVDGSTDIVVSADHGFSTIAKDSASSATVKLKYEDTPPGQLPPGFLAVDLATALGLKLYDPDKGNEAVDPALRHTSRGNGLLGDDPAHPQLIVAANGGSDLVYLGDNPPEGLVDKVLAALAQQDYVSGLFVADSLGPRAGALPLSHIGLAGKALTPQPAIVVSFASRPARGHEKQAELYAQEIADTGLQQGQGMHGSFSRADTWNFMAATGPDFRARFRDPMPASNADISVTLARLMGLQIAPKGSLLGRVLSESLKAGGKPARVTRSVERSTELEGRRTVLRTQSVGDTRYYDVAGFPGRTVGLRER
jgi:hypothetical protein